MRGLSHRFGASVVALLQCRRPGFSPWVGKMPWRREWPPVFLPGELHGQRSLAGYSSWGHKDSDTTEQLTLCCTTTAVLKTTENTQISRECLLLWGSLVGYSPGGRRVGHDLETQQHNNNSHTTVHPRPKCKNSFQQRDQGQPIFRGDHGIAT